MANPYPFRLQQPDGDITPELVLHGGPDFHYMTDINRYTVIKDKQSRFVYAIRNETTGILTSSGVLVGTGDPKMHGLRKGLLPKDKTKRELLDNSNRPQNNTANMKNSMLHHARRLELPRVMKNLVLLIRFSNHRNRELPVPQDLDILMNELGGDPFIAPTGSVKDVFKVNSYGKLSLESEVIGWIDLPYTEAYYANGTSGFGAKRYFEALHSALGALERQGFDFSRFDVNQDKKIDMVTLLHSGYAAENSGKDENGVSEENRIWSHHWSLTKQYYWTSSRTKMIVHQYSTSPCLWGLSGSSMGRIGVISHEIGHSLGLPDLYGTPTGNGIGSYDIMSNHWGFAPYHLGQYYPPLMSAWTKMLAGWLEPVNITRAGDYIIRASATHGQVYRIDLDNSGTEYLLIENRQAISFDIFLPQGGLAIWHINEKASNLEGFPGQETIEGKWPYNGRHYKVALLQADSKYDLERDKSQGDSGDLFRYGGVDALNPSTMLSGEVYPNTDAYQLGKVRNTGIRIFNISESNDIMSFSVQFLNGKLETSFLGGNGAAGAMFDVSARKDIVLQELELNIKEVGSLLVEIWTKLGTHVGFDSNPIAWTRLVATEVQGKGMGERTALAISPISLSAGERRAFYIIITNGGLRYSNGKGVGSEAASNDDLVIYEGIGKADPFGYTFNSRIWNGAIKYTVTPKNSTNRILQTTYDGGSGQAGNMFSVRASQDISVTAFDLHILEGTKTNVQIYTKEGNFANSGDVCGGWTSIGAASIIGAGTGKATLLPKGSTSPVLIRKGTERSFYIILKEGTGIRYSYGKGKGTVIAQDDNLKIYDGVGVASQCSSVYWNRTWNGAIRYKLA